MMKELLEQLGYKFIGTCNCDGHHTEKYRNGDYKVKWRTRQGKYKILKYGIDLSGWYPIENDYWLKDFYHLHATIQEKV